MNFFESSNADIFCIQESKMHRNQSNFEFKGYHQFWNEAEKKGYSGTVILSKIEPLSVKNDMGIPHHDKEGRIIVAEYPLHSLLLHVLSIYKYDSLSYFSL